MRSYFNTMLRYFEISGRSTRMQYWMFQLVFLVELAAAITIEFHRVDASTLTRLTNPITLFPVSLFVVLIHIVPNVTVQVRRLHDIGKSGAWYLLNFVPFGGVVLFYWACCGSEQGNNYYDGPAPSAYARQHTANTARHSTIPRAVRMGSASGTRAYAMGESSGDPHRFI